MGRFSPFLRSISGKKSRSVSNFPVVGVLTVPSTIISLVGDNTDHRRIAGSYLLRRGLFYPGLFFIGKGSSALLVRAQCHYLRLSSTLPIVLSIRNFLCRPRRRPNIYRWPRMGHMFIEQFSTKSKGRWSNVVMVDIRPPTGSLNGLYGLSINMRLPTGSANLL